MEYNATITLARSHDEDWHDQVLDELSEFHAITAEDDRRRSQIVLTLEAEDLSKAVVIAKALFAPFSGNAVAFEVLTTAMYDEITDKIAEIPVLLTVTEAAARLGISRQAVLGRIERGTLPARHVGKRRYVIPARALPADNATSRSTE